MLASAAGGPADAARRRSPALLLVLPPAALLFGKARLALEVLLHLAHPLAVLGFRQVARGGRVTFFDHE